MAGKGRVVYYSTEETLRAVLEGQSDESELEVSDSSDVESDHLSDPSDHSYTESAPTLPMMRMQETRLTFLLNLKTSPEEVVVEVKV